MEWLSRHPVAVVVMVLAGLCGIVALALQSIIGFVAAVILFLVVVAVAWRSGHSNGTENSPDTPVTSTDEKRWIDCAYCGGEGSIVADRLTTIRGVIKDERATCPVCHGDGQLHTRLWSQPVCRRCGGSGKLKSWSFNPRVFSQHVTTFTVCDRCRGTGRRPLPEE